MRIRWNGGGVVRRIVAGYEWSAETNYEQDVVEEDVAANLLTDPSGLFVAVDESEAEALFAPADEPEKKVKGKRRKSKKREVEGEGDSLAIFDRAMSAGEILNEAEDEGEDE
jgi:hypothetical protein